MNSLSMSISKIKFLIVISFIFSNFARAEWLNTKEGCSVEFPNIIDGEIPFGRKSSWTGECNNGVATGDGLLKINAGTEFKSVFSGIMKDGRFDGLVRYHWKFERTERTRKFKYAGNSSNAETYFHESVAVSEEEYNERVTYLSRFQNATTIANLESFLFSTTRYDPEFLADKVRKKLYEEKERKYNISFSAIEQEKENLLKLGNLESVFDIGEEDSNVKKEAVGVPLFIFSSIAGLQEPNAKFRLFTKKNPAWRAKYGSYKVAVRFKLEGNIKSNINLFFLKYQDNQKFRESGPTITFFLGESNGWSDIKNVNFKANLSHIILSMFGDESISVKAEDFKISYEITSVELL